MSRIKQPHVRIQARVMTTCALDHDVWCAALEECSCEEYTFRQIHKTRKGEVGIRDVAERHPKSVTFLVGQPVSMPRAVLDCPQVAAAVARGDLRVAR